MIGEGGSTELSFFNVPSDTLYRLLISIAGALPGGTESMRRRFRMEDGFGFNSSVMIRRFR